MHFVRNIGEVTVSVVPIKGNGLTRQTAWTAQDRCPLPLTLRFISGSRRTGKVKVDVVNDNQVEKTVPVKVHKSTTRAPPGLRSEKPSGLGFITERPVTLIVVENVLPPLRYEEVYMSVTVDVTRANALPPACMRQASLFRNIFKLQPP